MSRWIEVQIPVQAEPVCCGCGDKILAALVYAPFSCDHPECPSSVWHAICLSEDRLSMQQDEQERELMQERLKTPTSLSFRQYESQCT